MYFLELISLVNQLNDRFMLIPILNGCVNQMDFQTRGGTLRRVGGHPVKLLMADV